VSRTQWLYLIQGSCATFLGGYEKQRSKSVARPKNQEKRRRALIEAAERAIATRGLGALRLRDIAEEAGITGPAVSYYYPNLDDLLVDVYTRAIQKNMERGPAAIAELDDPWDQLIALLDVNLAQGPGDIDAIIMYQFSGEPRFTRSYGALSSALRTSEIGLYWSVIDTGVALGRFKPDLDSSALARAIVALADAYGLQIVVGEPGMDKATALAEIANVAASLLRTSSTADAAS